MTRISSHLPRLGALALAVVVAAVAYSVYNSGQSTGSNVASPAPRSAGLAAGGLTNDSAVVPKRNRGQDSKRPAHRVDGGVPIVASLAAASPVSGGAPGPGGPVLRPVATEPPVSAPKPKSKPGGGNRLDRELDRLINGPGAPNSKPKPVSPKPRAPAPTPNRPAPGGSAPAAPAPTQGTGSGATPTDPDAGLDDTPVGGLDQTDLGDPVDETNPVTTPTTNPGTTPTTDPGTAPTAPQAGVDDTAGGGLDQTDLGGPVDETNTGGG